MARFSDDEWKAIRQRLSGREKEYGFPTRRQESVILASFNIRDFGAKGKRSPDAWKLLARNCRRFDFIAIQEVEDNLESLDELWRRLGDGYDVVHSDITGALPGEIGPISPHERLAFVYRTDRIERKTLASDLTYDRSYLFRTLYDNREAIWKAFEIYRKKKEDFDAGRRKTKPYFVRLPKFLSFIRQPHCASFRIKARDTALPIDFTAFNAHLLYGNGLKSERRAEFIALLDWLLKRAQKIGTLPVNNLILFGDLNLDFKNAARQRKKYDQLIKDLNQKLNQNDVPAKVNFPFITPHPKTGDFLRSTARRKETYDQIGIFAHDTRLPDFTRNATAGQGGANDFNYWVVNFAKLFEDAVLDGRDANRLPKAQREAFYNKFTYDVSDHLPIWIRLPIPGA